jgi:hypothetical protein
MLQLDHPAPLLHLRAAVHGSALDDALAAGSDPAASPELALRAHRLLRPATRAGLARGLRRVVADASIGLRHPSAAVRPARGSVRACAPQLLTLAAELGDPGIRVQGVALTRRLLADGFGPLFMPGPDEALLEAVEQAREALCPTLS